jgi:nucleoside-diphosphate-sugar epimerase
VILGAGGFIGMHFMRYLAEMDQDRRAVLVDLRFPAAGHTPAAVRAAVEQGWFQQVVLDVRRPIPANALPRRVDAIINLAAICREPDFPPRDFFEVNVLGARHVAAWAAEIDCRQILFTSSVAVYGGDRGRSTEETLPVPLTAYGASKLAAEEIFRGWRDADPQRRSLTILRPGVIFGPGENANVARLIRAVLRGYFFYCGNRELPKAGAYVEELCRCLAWMQAREADTARLVIANFALPEPPRLHEYVEAIQRIGQRRRWTPSLPYGLLLGLARAFYGLASMCGIKTPIHPRRIEKLLIANDVVPAYLLAQGFVFRYTLEQSLARWREEAPEEWR